MKKTLFSFLYIIPALVVNAQVSSISENFNTSCATSAGSPARWIVVNPIASTSPLGAWTCSPTNGRDGTPGMECTGDYNTTYHLDTSFLITPELNLMGYEGNVYLQFDTKSKFIGGQSQTENDSVSVLVSSDSTFGNSAADSTLPVIHPIVPPLDTEWITEQVDLTPYMGDPFYIAFRYTSPNTYGTIWYLDNVMTTSVKLQVVTINKERLPLAVIGNATTSEIKLSFSTTIGGPYDLVIYNMMGSILYKQTLNTQTGLATYNINGLNLLPGMFFIKVGNGINYGIAKAVIE